MDGIFFPWQAKMYTRQETKDLLWNVCGASKLKTEQRKCCRGWLI